MMRYINNLLDAANDPDPASVRLLRVVLAVVSLSLASIALLLVFIHGRVGPGIIGAMIVASLSGITLWMSRRNIHWAGRLLFPLVALLALTLMAVTTDGLHDSTMVGFSLVIIVASLLAGQKAIPLATVSTIMAIWLIAYLDITGVNQSLFARATKQSDAIGLAVVISIFQVIAAAALNALMSRLNVVLETVRRSEKELLENNRELTAIRASLEDKVAERTQAAEAARANAELQAWSARGQAQLADVLRGDLDLSTLADRVTAFLCKYLGAQTGALFVLYEDTLKLTGRYAYAENKNRKTEFRVGETLVGEAARRNRYIKLIDIPADALLIASSLGSAKPSQILIAPIETEGVVYAVLELATLSAFSADHEHFLRLVTENIAIAFRTAQTRLRVNELLLQSQQQAEELMSQEEELRAANEELQAQADSLRIRRRGAP